MSSFLKIDGKPVPIKDVPLDRLDALAEKGWRPLASDCTPEQIEIIRKYDWTFGKPAAEIEEARKRARFAGLVFQQAKANMDADEAGVERPNLLPGSNLPELAERLREEKP